MSLFDLNDYYVGEEGTGSWNPSLTAPEGTSIYIVDPTTTKKRDAIAFDGTGMHFDAADDPALRSDPNGISVVYMSNKADSTGDSAFPVDKGVFDPGGSWGFKDGTGVSACRFFIRNAADDGVVGVNGPRYDGAWGMYFGWYDPVAQTVNAQKDDDAPFSAPATTGINPGTAPLKLHGQVGGSGYYVGDNAYLLIFSGYVLTAEDRTWLVNGKAYRTADEIKTYFAGKITAGYALNEETGAAIDFIGSNDLARTGTPGVADGPVLETPNVGDRIYSISDYMNVQVDLNADYVADPANRPRLQQDADGNYYLDMLTGVYDSLRARVGNTYWDGDRRDITVVFERNATNTSPYLMGGHNPGGSNFYMRCFGAELRYRWGGSGTGELRTNGAGIAADTKTVVQAIMDSRAGGAGVCYGYVNGINYESYPTADIGLKPSQDSIFMGARDSSTSSAVRIYYMQILPSAWNTKGYREQLNDWLAARYNLTVTKPVDPATDVPVGTGIYVPDPQYCFTSAALRMTDGGTEYYRTQEIQPKEDGDWSMSMWVYKPAGSNWCRWFSFGSGHNILQISDSLLYWDWYDESSTRTRVNAGSIPANAWSHICLVREAAGNHTVYVNGVATGTPQAAALNAREPNVAMSIGTSVVHGNQRGQQLCLYSGYALDAADIAWLYNAGAGQISADIRTRFGPLLSDGWTLDDAGAGPWSNFVRPTNFAELLNGVTDGPAPGHIEEPGRIGFPVTRWVDSLGALEDFLQPSALAAPILQTDLRGYYMAPDGVDDYMDGAGSFPGTDPMDWIVAYRNDDKVATRTIMTSPEPAGSGYWVQDNASPLWTSFLSNQKWETAYDQGVTYVLGIRRNGVDGQQRIDGYVGNTVNLGPSADAGIRLFSRGNAVNQIALGRMRYLIAAPSLLSAAQLRNAEQWLIEKYRFA